LPWLSGFRHETSTPSAEPPRNLGDDLLVGLGGPIEGELGVLAVEGLAQVMEGADVILFDPAEGG
jgi:hypothetical protein